MDPVTTSTADSPWWRVDQAAAYARVHKSQIFRACAARQLEHVRIGGRRTIVLKQAFVDAWLQSQIVHVATTGGAR